MKDIRGRIRPNLENGALFEFLDAHRVVHLATREGDSVNIGTVLAISTIIVFGISPRVGVWAFAYWIGGSGPVYATTPFVLCLSINLECQFVFPGFGLDSVADGLDGVPIDLVRCLNRNGLRTIAREIGDMETFHTVGTDLLYPNGYIADSQ